MSQHKTSPEEIEADIARQRDELAATVAELQYRLDVKSRTAEKLAELKSRPPVVAGVAIALVAVVGLVVWRRRKH
jgi:hypothetical protein